MFRAYLIIVATGIIFVFAGCSGETPKKNEGNPAKLKVEEKALTLTAETAKQALLEMDAREIRPGVIVPYPEDKPIEVINADEISIGAYRCNLKEKTFHVSAFFPDALRHKSNHLSGVFERSPEGKWIAKVTKSSSGGR